MRTLALLIPAFAIFFACNGPAVPAADQETMTKEIKTLESKIYNESTKRMDPAVVGQYVTAIEGYSAAFPKDGKSVEMLLKAGEMARNVGQYDKALGIYDKVMNEFKDHPKAAQALFLKAFTMDDNLGKKDQAKVLYESFIEKYPNDEFAASAKFMLENLFKSNSEIIEGFEQNKPAETEEKK